MGDDVLYSGTVAAAMEGRFLGYPSIAASMDSHQPQHYATGVKVVVELLQKLITTPLSQNTILNVNIPDIPYHELKGTQITRLGYRHKAEPVVKTTDPRGKPIYWVGPAGKEADAGKGTDFYALRHQMVSITPLQADLTHYKMLEPLEQWLAK
jgi:5'-nucleotidase